MLQRFLMTVGMLAFASVALAQPGVGKKKGEATPLEGKAIPKAGQPRKFDDVITKDAKSSPGMFTVHRIDDKVYFEIPEDALQKLMLWQTEVVKGPAGVSWGGLSLSKSYLRFERRGNKVYLWSVSFAKRGDGKAVQTAVDAANMDSIIYSFNVEAEGKDRSVVINATPLYMTDINDLSVKRAVGGGAGNATIDEARSYLDEVKAFPTNIEARSLLTFRGGGAPAGPIGGKKGPAAPAAAGGGRSYTALVHYSLVKLPERPMQGRYFDARVGFFTHGFENYASSKTWMEKQQYITRFRLEKKDPTAEVSEPVKPIVFYIAREVPEQWRKYLIQGVNDWKPAFEKAGFKNAIIGKEAPDPRQDPTWDPEDARYNVIRWVAEPTQNAMGPHVHDPRSGEIISAHIIFWHDILKLTQQWYFIQCSAQDQRCQKLPLPDDVTGELLRYVSAHEVGHTLGLRHNHRASSAYTIEQLRDPAFTVKQGTVASIMAYGRFNYVAQPEDKLKTYVPVIGPYDNFAIDWGYKAIANASPEQERATLDKWASRQLDEPWLRFGGEDGPAAVDPTVKTENIGSDSLKATELGLKNVDRVLDRLVDATTSLGEDFELLKDTYKQILAHRRNWFNAVALNVGGVVENRTLGGRGAETFTRVPKEKQQAAVKFLLDHAFTTPTKVINPVIVNRFQHTGVAGDVMGQQKTLLASVLGGARLRRMLDAELVLGDKAYTAMELVNDVQAGVWSELKSDAPKVDALRRNLQRSYLEILAGELLHKDDPAAAVTSTGDEPTGKNGDFRGIARAALHDLTVQIDSALQRTNDSMTRVHLRDSRREVETMLEGPKK
jgi:hypothetical protein